VVFLYECCQTLPSYAELGKKNSFPELEQCPQCKARNRLKRHGFYFRYAVEGEVVYQIPICRLKCPSCKRTVSLLPDFLIPYFQHTLHTVITWLKDKLSNSTSHRSRQLAWFYLKRFFRQLNQVEMFFRALGWKEKSPSQIKEKAIKLLEMIRLFGEAPFLRKSRGHFKSNFMASHE